MEKDDMIVSRNWGEWRRRGRKADREKREENDEEPLSVRRLFLPLTLGRPLHLSFDFTRSWSLFLSLSFSPFVSRSYLPFSHGFLLLLAAGTWAWTWARWVFRAGERRPIPDQMSHKSYRLSDLLILSSTATSLPIQFHGGRSPRIPSSRTESGTGVCNTPRENIVDYYRSYRRMRANSINSTFRSGSRFTNLRKKHPDSDSIDRNYKLKNLVGVLYPVSNKYLEYSCNIRLQIYCM